MKIFNNEVTKVLTLFKDFNEKYNEQISIKIGKST